MATDPLSEGASYGCTIGCATFVVFCMFIAVILGVSWTKLPSTVYYVGAVVGIAVGILVYQRIRGSFKALEEVSLPEGESEVCRVYATYYGGHKSVGEKADVQLILTSVRVRAVPLGHPVFAMDVDLTSITDFGMDIKERITASRMLLVGILAFALKKKEKYLWTKYTDNLGFEQNPVFGSEITHQLAAFQTKLYRAISEIRGNGAL